ncbi:histidine phosphatase family protein [Mycobacterium botniense]|uniref:histidine phosphatase family protein n=1 Tax=Mycobacterium botniense TaxID=84962 RepID=UPI001FE40232|nr:histidine phosphatase family protein [Mycobacterium botniense]
MSTGVVAGNVLPGSPLSDLGQDEAQEVGTQLANQLGSPDAVAGIFEGQNIRMAQTAAPFAALEQETPHILSGLNEIGGGIYAGDPYSGPGGILYDLTLLTWAFGYEFVPMPGSLDFNGIAFEDYFSNAVATMYADALANPIVSANGQVTDVAFSGEAAISTWTLLNAKNPDLAIFLPRFVEAVLSRKTPVPAQRRRGGTRRQPHGGMDAGQLRRATHSARSGIADAAHRRLPGRDHPAADGDLQPGRGRPHRQRDDDPGCACGRRVQRRRRDSSVPPISDR